MIGGMAVARDVSAPRAAECALAERNRELERSNAELEQFAYVASHDLSEPLRMVSSYLQLLRRRYERPPRRRRRRVHRLRRRRRRAHAAADRRPARLLARRPRRARRRAGRHRAALVDRVADDLRRRDGRAARIARGDAARRSRATRTQLGQLFQNLIGNAIKFARPTATPRVEVTAEPDGAAWRFTVPTTASASTPAHAERIFRMFQRLHGRDEYPGTGIGLAIAKKVVERHGGASGPSRAPDGGTRFRFTLPEATRRDDPDGRASSLVEDNPGDVA